MICGDKEMIISSKVCQVAQVHPSPEAEGCPPDPSQGLLERLCSATPYEWWPTQLSWNSNDENFVPKPLTACSTIDLKIPVTIVSQLVILRCPQRWTSSTPPWIAKLVQTLFSRSYQPSQAMTAQRKCCQQPKQAMTVNKKLSALTGYDGEILEL